MKKVRQFKKRQKTLGIFIVVPYKITGALFMKERKFELWLRRSSTLRTKS
jgi:hypothetical protein